MKMLNVEPQLKKEDIIAVPKYASEILSRYLKV